LRYARFSPKRWLTIGWGEAVAGVRWSEEETKRALYLYFQLPFGQLHQGNHEIIALARDFDRTPSSIAMKLANFASLDPKIRKSGRTGLEGASAQDRRIWAEFNSDWTRLIMDAEAIVLSRPTTGARVQDSASALSYEPFSGPSTSTAMIEQRVGQNFFRRAVLANYDNRCCVTGITDARLLNASHIKPWATDEKNRHNPRNGLCLSATFDRAFDRGLMAVDQMGKARFSKALLESPSAETRAFFDPYEGQPIISATRFDPDPGFLAFHHATLFKPDRVHA